MTGPYWLIPRNKLLPEKLTGHQLLKKFPAFYGTRRFITAFTTARHLSLSWASSNQSIPPHRTSWRSILILSSHLRLVLPSGLFPSVFSTKTLHTPLISLIRTICLAHHSIWSPEQYLESGTWDVQSVVQSQFATQCDLLLPLFFQFIVSSPFLTVFQ